MTNLQKFNHPMFGELLVVVSEGSEWFGASEAAAALSFSNPRSAIINHIDEEDVTVHDTPTNSGIQKKKYVNESGLYSLIFGASKQGNNPEIKRKAKQFKRWVTSEVLPAIRKHGAYMTPETIEKVLSDPDTIIQLATTLKQEQAKRMAAEALMEKQRPKVLFANAVQTSETSILIGQLAKLITQNGVEIGQNRLFEWLRNNGYLGKRGSHYNEPTQYAVERGWFEVKERTINNPDGSVRITRTTKVTGKGQLYFINKFLGDKNKLWDCQ